VLADAELVHGLAEGAGDDEPREVSLDGGDVDTGGRSFRHASTVAALPGAGLPRSRLAPIVTMRILLVSQMYPSPAEPDFGAFVRQGERELERRGHEIARAVIDRRGGSRRKYARLAIDALTEARRLRPDVVYAHFLFPAGAAAAAAARAAGAGLVVTAHGTDVRNIGSIPGVSAGTRLALRRARVVAVSDYLRSELVARLPGLDGRVDVVDSGVDLERFRGGDARAARAQLGWNGESPFFLCLGRLTDRKNVVRLADAFARLGKGSLAFVGDGPLRAELERRAGVRVVGSVPHDEVPGWIAACDVLCQPSLVEPFGQALLEALASERPVVATRVGGPPEFVHPDAGVLVDPESVEAIGEGLRAASELPVPNAAARTAAAAHDVRVQAERIERILQDAAAQ
jgi:glycosyltransferase involved in cell wall biosynthesis